MPSRTREGWTRRHSLPHQSPLSSTRTPACRPPFFQDLKSEISNPRIPMRSGNKHPDFSPRIPKSKIQNPRSVNTGPTTLRFQEFRYSTVIAEAREKKKTRQVDRRLTYGNPQPAGSRTSSWQPGQTSAARYHGGHDLPARLPGLDLRLHCELHADILLGSLRAHGPEHVQTMAYDGNRGARAASAAQTQDVNMADDLPRASCTCEAMDVPRQNRERS